MARMVSDLIDCLENCEVFSCHNIAIRNIVDDSRKADAGSLFVAINGLHVDSHKFIPEAIKKGAKFIISEKRPIESIDLDEISYVKAKDSRRALGLIASAWFDNPSKKMIVIGITGTDGKTTTSNIIYWILKTAGKRVGLISTVNAKIGDKEYDTGFHVTNPEPLQLQSFLKKMVDEKCEYAVLEVTSHGLDQERVAGIKFDIGVLTNVSHEHLDYHRTYDNYLKTKAKLFKNVKTAILNKNDKSFSFVKRLVDNSAKVVAYDFSKVNQNIKNAINSRFPEIYNQQNAVAAVEAVKELGIEDKDIVEAIRTFPAVEGRMEEIANKKGMRVIVDFAHTPNALEKVLTVLKSQLSESGRLICVFGCAGERDIKKRSMMGKISAKLADLSIFTAEDPRFENVNKIIDQMIKGANENRDPNRYFIEPDRRKAIELAIKKAGTDDIIVVCGKGHEKSMNFNGIEHPWSDKKAVLEILAKSSHKT